MLLKLVNNGEVLGEINFLNEIEDHIKNGFLVMKTLELDFWPLKFLLKFSSTAAPRYHRASILVTPITAVIISIALELFVHTFFVVALQFRLATS